MALYNKYTPFTATVTASTPVGPNQSRRGLRVQIYGPPDVTSNTTVWLDTTKTAVSFQSKQIISGGEAIWGELNLREFQHTPAMVLPNCPTGAISVVTASGSAQGLIEEFF